jgi:hypothetical protein
VHGKGEQMIELSQKRLQLNSEKMLLAKMWIQMPLVPSVKVWDVNGQIERLTMKGWIGWQMEDSSCISSCDIKNHWLV